MAEIREVSFSVKCVACGAKYKPKYLWFVNDSGKRECIGASDHVCDPARLARKEERLRHEWDDPENYCECDDLDCKFEYLDAIRNEME